MSAGAASWAAQQLAEFLGAVSAVGDEAAAAREGVERAAEAVDAECAALVRGGTVVAWIGWPRFDLPERELLALRARGSGTIDVPGSGTCPATVVALEGEDAGLVVARAATPLTGEERTLL